MIHQAKGFSLIEMLLGMDYKLYWHLPPYFSTTNHYGNSQNPFDNTISVNMLGIHSSVKADIQDLCSVESPQSDWRRAKHIQSTKQGIRNKSKTPHSDETDS